MPPCLALDFWFHVFSFLVATFWFLISQSLGLPVRFPGPASMFLVSWSLGSASWLYPGSCMLSPFSTLCSRQPFWLFDLLCSRLQSRPLPSNSWLLVCGLVWQLPSSQSCTARASHFQAQDQSGSLSLVPDSPRWLMTHPCLSSVQTSWSNCSCSPDSNWDLYFLDLICSLSPGLWPLRSSPNHLHPGHISETETFHFLYLAWTSEILMPIW